MSVFDYEDISYNLKAIEQLIFMIGHSEAETDGGSISQALFFLAEAIAKASEDVESLFNEAVELERKRRRFTEK